jgi:hypothetical protein
MVLGALHDQCRGGFRDPGDGHDGGLVDDERRGQLRLFGSRLDLHPDELKERHHPTGQLDRHGVPVTRQRAGAALSAALPAARRFGSPKRWDSAGLKCYCQPFSPR